MANGWNLCVWLVIATCLKMADSARTARSSPEAAPQCDPTGVAARLFPPSPADPLPAPASPRLLPRTPLPVPASPRLLPRTSFPVPASPRLLPRTPLPVPASPRLLPRTPLPVPASPRLLPRTPLPVPDPSLATARQTNTQG